VTLARDRRRGKKKYLAQQKVIKWPGYPLCMNGCGERGPHFVPPSMGEPGFFICTSISNQRPEEN
jgi:hypothetical protein